MDIRLSVLIPVFNRRDLVLRAIDSALAQRVAGMEIVVIDNCSTDGTWEFVSKLRNDRLRVLRNDTNIGLFGNFNRCGEETRGEYSLFLCSDDCLAPGFLQAALDEMSHCPSAVLLSSRGIAVDRNGRTLESIAARFPPGLYSGVSATPAWFWTNYFYGGNPLNYPSGVLFRTKALQAALPFRAQLGAPADIDLYLRVLAQGDLLVSETVGCFVLRHTQQAGESIRRTGELTRQDLGLLQEFRPLLEEAGVFEQVRRQAAYHVLRTLLQVARNDPRAAARLFHEFSYRPSEMIVAGARQKFLRMIEALTGRVQLRHLEPAAFEP